MSLVRVAQTAQVALTHTFVVDETPTDAVGDVTCTLKRLDGTPVTSGTATHPSTGQYQFTVPAQTQLDMLTLDWQGTVGGAVHTARDFVEIVGGFLFNLAVARKRYNWPPQKYPTSFLAEMRTQVEQECEDIAGWAFVPRFARVTVPGRGRRELVLPMLKIRTVRAVTVDGVAWSAVDVSGINVSETGVLTRLFGSPWPSGQVIVELEHGFDVPPVEISTNTAYRMRTLLAVPDTIVDERATSYTVPDGGTYRLATPGAKSTGVPTIDAAYHRNGVGGVEMAFA